MKGWWSWGAIGLAIGAIALPAVALPGETVINTQAWIRLNPHLGEAGEDGLTVQRHTTAAQQWQFHASPLPALGLRRQGDRDRIRHEQIRIWDLLNGVTPDRLTESVRIIYGPPVGMDYDQAQVLYRYPLNPRMMGELRLGQTYAYWWEISFGKGPSPIDPRGQITLLQKEDAPALEKQLRQTFAPWTPKVQP